jgi:RimJ/RimL family protein N-acetyltransferase
MAIILPDFPSSFETERLYIRAPQMTDATKVHDAMIASFEQLKAWMPWAQQLQSFEETSANLQLAIDRFQSKEDLRFLAFLKSTGEFVVSSGLHRIDWTIPRFEIGYWQDTRHVGNGYVTETVNGLTTFAFQQLHAARVEIRIDVANSRSILVPERCGYSLEGILRKNLLSSDGQDVHDMYIYSKVKE